MIMMISKCVLEDENKRAKKLICITIDGNVFHESCSGNIILSDGSISMSPSGIIHMVRSLVLLRNT